MTFALLACSLLAPPPQTVFRIVDVGPVWAGHPVGFSLLTVAGRQFVAFYDAERRMTVAARTLDQTTWHFVRLPQTLGWDSHNYVTLAADDEGLLHLSGNLHVNPLVYFRTTKPFDIDTFHAATPMVGDREQRCTYPQFFRGPHQEFIFTYRDGASGNGDQVFNVWDGATRKWSRLLDRPLTDGEGHRNAYFVGPVAGPDGWWHLVWVWRESPDCATNHDLSYARSRDLRHWETSDGRPLTLPITLGTAEIVEPVPVNGGIINGNMRIGFDSQQRVILTYHRYDPQGFTQLYCSRREADGWKRYRVSSWQWRWDFAGGGSIPFGIGFGPVTLGAEGKLRLTWRHIKYGSGTWVLHEPTLKPIEEEPRQPSPLDAYGKSDASFPRLQVNWLRGEGGAPGVGYALRWETLGPNRDRPREGALPPAGMMRLYEVGPEPGPTGAR